MATSDILIVIPARMASTRFPGKPLADLGGKPMLQWVYEACQRSGISSEIVIATPDPEIIVACQQFGASAVLTRNDHPSGTDRIAEVCRDRPEPFVVNVQGDEPFIPIETIRACAAALTHTDGAMVASVYADCTEHEVEDPAVVKVVLNIHGEALYFSRSPIPFRRNVSESPLKRHLGIYGFTRDILLKFVTLPQGVLEATEGLEQLRFLENRIPIQMAKGVAGPTAVDTPGQLEELRRLSANVHR